MWPFRRKKPAELTPEPLAAQAPASPATRTADDVLRELESRPSPPPQAGRAGRPGRAARPVDPTLGQFLLAEGPVTREFLHRQLAVGGKRESYLGRLLAKFPAPPEAELFQALAADYQVQDIDLKQCRVQIPIARSIPREMAIKYKTIPFERVGDLLCVVFADPPNPKAIEAIVRATGLRVKAFRCPPHHIQLILQRLYPRGAVAQAVAATPISEKEYAEATEDAAAKAEARWEALYAARGPIRASRVARR